MWKQYSMRLQLGEGPSRGLLRDSETGEGLFLALVLYSQPRIKTGLPSYHGTLIDVRVIF